MGQGSQPHDIFQDGILSHVSAEPKTLVALATFNEIENIPCLVAEIFSVLPTADVLIVDDNSPDGTGDWCRQTSTEEPRLRCLHRPAKQGLGSATIAAMRHAITADYQRIVTLDADFSHAPRHLPALLRGADDVDVMIGSRYCPGGAIENWPLRRRLLSRVFNAASRLLLRLPVRDCSGNYRCYRTDTLRQLDLDEIRTQGYAYLEEILWHLQRAGATFGETPIVFSDRAGGSSKADVREGLAATAMLLRLGFRTWFLR